MKVPKETVHKWVAEWANTPSIATSYDPMEYIAQRAADYALEQAAKVCDEEAMDESDDFAMRRMEACARTIRKLKGYQDANDQKELTVHTITDTDPPDESTGFSLFGDLR